MNLFDVEHCILLIFDSPFLGDQYNSCLESAYLFIFENYFLGIAIQNDRSALLRLVIFEVHQIHMLCYTRPFVFYVKNSSPF